VAHMSVTDDSRRSSIPMRQGKSHGVADTDLASGVVAPRACSATDRATKFLPISNQPNRRRFPVHASPNPSHGDLAWPPTRDLSTPCSAAAQVRAPTRTPFSVPQRHPVVIHSGIFRRSLTAPDPPPSAGPAPVADVLLWRRRNASAAAVVGATAVWFVFERAGYSLPSVLANALLLLVAILFFWAKSASLLNRCVTRLI
jgi:hypothetical protein